MELINYWRNPEILKEALYIHPRDKKCLVAENHYPVTDYNEIMTDKRFRKFNHRLHLSLTPEPYIGDITNAKVYILLLNPGFNRLDYYVEGVESVKTSMVNNLRQKFNGDDKEFPLIWLNPKNIWTPGGIWTENKFKPLINHVMRKMDLSYLESLKLISKKVAMLELVPYHSKYFGLKKKEIEMQSVIEMRNFVKNILVPKAHNDECCIIQTRSIKEWDLGFPEENNGNIIVYPVKQRRSSSLSETSKAWAKMTDFIFRED